MLEEVRGACEILGLDPLYVANEGKLIAIVGRGAADEALALLRAHPLGAEAAIIGEVVTDTSTKLVKKRLQPPDSKQLLPTRRNRSRWFSGGCIDPSTR